MSPGAADDPVVALKGEALDHYAAHFGLRRKVEDDPELRARLWMYMGVAATDGSLAMVSLHLERAMMDVLPLSADPYAAQDAVALHWARFRRPRGFFKRIGWVLKMAWRLWR